MILTLYRAASTLGAPLIRLYLNRRLAQGKEEKARFHERLGRTDTPRPAGKLVWLHAASVGESLSMLPLIEKIRATYPLWSVLVTTGTVTSARLMVERLPGDAIHQYVPVDRVAYVRRFLEHWQPDLGIWAESEFWPNLVIETRARAVPMVVLNGRMSPRSHAKWLKYPAMIKRILSSFREVLAQSEADAQRFRDLGAANVQVTGNLKYAMGALPGDAHTLAELRRAVAGRPLWLAASTHPGEEVLIGAVHQALLTAHPDLLTLVVPRHPDRGAAIASALAAGGLRVALRSRGEAIGDDTQIYIADTLGELGLFYRLAGIVFMGKSLAVGGGQNPLEAAFLDTAIVFGPDMSNFEDMAQRLRDAGAAQAVADANELARAVDALLTHEARRSEMAQAALRIAERQQDVMERTLARLDPYFATTPESSHEGA